MKRALVPGLLLVALFVPQTGIVPPFWMTLVVMIAISAIVVIGLVILTGVGGMTSFGQAAFFGVGAYTSAVLTLQYGLNPWFSLPASILLSGLCGLLIGLITVRLSGYFLPVSTLCWGAAMYYFFGSQSFLGGYNGMTGLPPVTVAGFALRDSAQFWPIVLLALSGVIWLSHNLLHSAFGRSIRFINKGNVAAEAFGISPARLKLLVFIYAACLAGLAGWLYAHFQRGVTPTTFNLNASIEFLMMAVIGGQGRLMGAIAGSTLIILLRNLLQDLIPNVFGLSAHAEIIALGLILIIALQVMPKGIVGLFQSHGPSPESGAAISNARDAETAVVTPVTRAGRGQLVVERICKNFGGLKAVDSISFTVSQGEIVTLLGPNGAGKSTTFNLVSGAASLSSGEVRLGTLTLSDLPPARVVHEGIARTFQHPLLVPDMSVIENVAVGAALHSNRGFLKSLLGIGATEEQEIFRRAAAELKRLGLIERAALRADALSLGETRLVEIARALCTTPTFLLLDEPAAGLRFSEKEKLMSVLTDLRAQGVGILLVEHDMHFVMTISDRIVAMDFGTHIATGTVQEIRENRDVQAAYLGADI